MSDKATKPEAIKEAVRVHYGEVAKSASRGTSCCASSSDTCCSEESALYTKEELAKVPNEAASSSRGCGNPVALASLRPGETVLDLGSGGGIDVLLAARRVGPTGFVYGLDMTDEMLELARRNMEKAGITNAAFLKGDIESIPLPDASVDVIISNCVINLAPDKGRALREAFRVLRPGGRLAVSDIVIDPNLEGLSVSEDQIRLALSWVGCIAGALTSRQYAAYLENAGFAEIEIGTEQRYSVEDVAGVKPLAGLAPHVVKELVGRFTSSSITAQRPPRHSLASMA
ncbi:MAG: methyltransferase type 11 [Candidatus Fraserbacteria bacterium RBG_16_55_9]|uniref:Arsenite methyltransferase n=1 Tax=Fraserbacteria sp. (strain RBG_16_55_9) TaxID=1817864 RepID=A0A1F5UY14_FRAXR|nr:MAG: methyltransferase type 11 [Candidatus Fraserbacteria bacterium RBG_16_55_9]